MTSLKLSQILDSSSVHLYIVSEIYYVTISVSRGHCLLELVGKVDLSHSSSAPAVAGSHWSASKTVSWSLLNTRLLLPAPSNVLLQSSLLTTRADEPVSCLLYSNTLGKELSSTDPAPENKILSEF